MPILLATGEPDLTEILRQSFVVGKLDVLDSDVLHRNYLNEIIEEVEPRMIVLHDVYLPSDFTTQAEMDEEMLQLVSHWRTKYDNKLRVVYLCERDRRDPFLGNLVARNVLDIFNERQISEAHFVKQLSEEARFINVSKFGVGGLEVEFDEETKIHEEDDAADDDFIISDERENRIEQGADLAKKVLSQLSAKAKNAVEVGNEWNEQRIKNKNERPVLEKEPKEKSNQLGSLDLMPIPKEIYSRTQVIGTVVIAVAGAKSHLGSTHTAMSIAAFLQKGRHSVALIELNGSEDFERIHALYEGEQYYIRDQSKFNYRGIDHFKYRENIRLGEIMSTYEYVVLDLGTIEDSPHYDEFLRSHVRVLLVSPYEWKQHWTDRFCEQVDDEEHFVYLVPFAEKSNVEDMQDRLPNLYIVPFPNHANPYHLTEEGNESVRAIMHGFLKESAKGFSKKMILAACVGTAIFTTVLISAFVFL